MQQRLEFLDTAIGDGRDDRQGDLMGHRGVDLTVGGR
jgi:hypothetical protein